MTKFAADCIPSMHPSVYPKQKEAEIRWLEEKADAERRAEGELLRIETGAYPMSISICATLTCK